MDKMTEENYNPVLRQVLGVIESTKLKVTDIWKIHPIQ